MRQSARSRARAAPLRRGNRRDRLSCAPRVDTLATRRIIDRTMSAPPPRVVMDPGVTYRRLVPVNRLTSPITATDDVYVIAHMGVARVDLAPWRLRVEGLVQHPFELDYGALTALPATEIKAVLECFGNPVEPEVATRRVGNVVWRGVRLAHLLERAGVRPEARYVCPEGLDSGSFANVYSERYVKDLPLARALEPDVLVAWAMNGAPLTPEHGFPARVFVPGYFGTNAVKWLSRITLAAERPESLFTTRLYNRRVAGETRPVRELDVHADCGATWRPARIVPRGADHQWQAFAFEWDAAAPGRYELHARATDERGRVQPSAGRNRVHSINVAVG